GPGNAEDDFAATTVKPRQCARFPTAGGEPAAAFERHAPDAGRHFDGQDHIRPLQMNGGDEGWIFGRGGKESARKKQTEGPRPSGERKIFRFHSRYSLSLLPP